MKFTISSVARADLREIATHIARDNPPRARSFVGELVAKIREVADQPLIYPLRPVWGADYRSALHRSYHIVFRIRGETVEIMRVVHGARDIIALLDGE